MKKQAIFICGPTAVGKTEVAIQLAQWLQTEIISFDSRQFYRQLKIGAAPPSTEELQQVPHHFIAHLAVDESLSAGQFEEAALSRLREIFKRHNQAVLVGGSGLYMKALSNGFDEMPQVNPQVRDEVRAEYEKHGLEKLQAHLAEKDPEFYRQVDLQNPQRLMRALEIIRSSGNKYSELRKANRVVRPFEIIKIGLNMPREKLYQRIKLRVDKMMERGLLEEAKALYSKRHLNALQTVGYKELFAHFEGKLSLPEAVEEIKKNSRRYAKRQLTWFRRDEEISWFEPQQTEEMKQMLSKKLDL